MIEADRERLHTWLDSMAESLREKLGTALPETHIVGIRRGGVQIAHALHSRLKCQPKVGELNINFYRDDFSRSGRQPHVGPSHLPTNIDDTTVLLVDDVLYSGRTVRAALNEIFDFGRPRRVVLAVLVSRDGRELPIEADVVGKRLQLRSDEHIKLTTDPLQLRREHIQR